MKPVTDEQLILHYYGEAPDAEELGRQIEASPELQRRFEALRGMLDAVEQPEIPERHPSMARRSGIGWLRSWSNVDPGLGLGESRAAPRVGSGGGDSIAGRGRFSRWPLVASAAGRARRSRLRRPGADPAPDRGQTSRRNPKCCSWSWPTLGTTESSTSRPSASWLVSCGPTAASIVKRPSSRARPTWQLSWSSWRECWSSWRTARR